MTDPIWDENPAADPFGARVKSILDGMTRTLIEKNTAYGNAALDPVRVFSNADPTEQLRVRIDDKLSRIARGHEYGGEDTIRDLLGYLVLYLIATDGDTDG